MRKLIAGVAGIVLFTAAALGGVWVLTRDPGETAPARVPSAAPEAPRYAPAPIPQVPSTPATPFAPPASPPTLVVVGPPPVEPPKGSWEAVPVVARASALGPMGGAIGRGLIELQPRLAACFDEDTQARFGTTPHSVVKDETTLDDHGAPVLLLQIETAPGAATIVDAPVETQGTASDGLVACAQQILRGQRFSVPQAQKGGRYRLIHPLAP